MTATERLERIESWLRRQGYPLDVEPARTLRERLDREHYKQAGVVNRGPSKSCCAWRL